MKVAISGGSGIIGKRLSEAFLAAGNEVVVLTRNASEPLNGISFSQWDPSKKLLDKAALRNVDVVINLAGASISQKWTKESRELIVQSRIDSTSTLVNWLNGSGHQVKRMISASAIGFYPFSDELQQESSPSGNHFMSEVCQKWENEAKKLNSSVALTIVRIGVVLSKKGGALEKMKPPFKMGFGSALGNGKQWMSWIHEDDLSSIFLHCVDQQIDGIINAVAPYPAQNSAFSKSLAKTMSKPFWAPKVPAFVLKILLGEMSAVVLGSQKVSSKKVHNSGFSFKFPQLETALEDLLG
ncbi:MAG: TIGR01777 family oxidoreductase [Flavobacteriales bacterium]